MPHLQNNQTHLNGISWVVLQIRFVFTRGSEWDLFDDTY